jgi:uncharacterized protein (TIGR03000 family)
VAIVPAQADLNGPLAGEATAPAVSTARIEVRLPVADAQVWVAGRATSSRGLVRIFESPALAPGNTYRYTLRATWLQNGQPVTEERQVNVTAGEVSVADFTSAPVETIAPPG